MNEQKPKNENVKQALKFALFSASAGIIQVAAFALLTELLPETESPNAFMQWFFNSEYGAAYLVALVLSVLWNFTFNRKFTFKSATNVPIAMLKVFGFYCVFAPVSTVLGELATGSTDWAGMEYVVLAVTMLTNMTLEFLFCKFFVYKGSENTAK